MELKGVSCKEIVRCKMATKTAQLNQRNKATLNISKTENEKFWNNLNAFIVIIIGRFFKKKKYY